MYVVSIKKMHLQINLVVLCLICVYSLLPLLTQGKELLYEYSMTRGGVEYNVWVYKYFPAKIYCENYEPNSYLTDASSLPNDTLSITFLSVFNCLPINSTYVEIFQALNIDVPGIESLTMDFTRDSPLPPGNYTEGLTVQDLVIDQWISFYSLEIPPNFLQPLNKLKSMSVSSIKIPPLPETMQLTDLTLIDSSVIQRWGNCQHLKYLYLDSIEDIPIWPPNCTRLEHLLITNLWPDKTLLVAERMIAAAPSLRNLSITGCELDSLPIELMRAAKNLAYLNLSHNILNDKSLQDFPYHAALQTLDLSGNTFQGDGLVSLVPKLPVLRELFFREENYFNFNSICFEPPVSLLLESLQKSSFEFIDFTGTKMDLFCFYNTLFSKLKHIRFSKWESVSFADLPQTDAEHLEIVFDNHEIFKIDFFKDDYETLERENSSLPYIGRNLTILLENNFISCDCENRWLVGALQDFPHIISMPNLTCDHKNGIPVLEIPKEHTECEKINDDYCTYRQWPNGTVIAECDKEGWIKMKHKDRLHGLNVSGQDIRELHTKLQDNIKWLDLRRNSLSRANVEEAAVLFAAERKVWLADNLWLCDCGNRALLDAIQQHREQVQDYYLLKCLGTGEALSSISTDVLCQVALIASLSVCGVLLVIAGVIALLLRRYGEQLSMFLYSRGWCISCLQSMDMDDKPYDAFLSFAHEDGEYVMETLLPGLENAPEKFRICVHYRDWFVGDWIPSQIMRSVQLSRRTLILLSRNFVASAWSTLEFRYSLANAVDDPNAKVLVLIKDDVLDMNLDKELRRYLTFHTYLRCDDPWFWEKLRYAMPHRVKNNSSGTKDIEMGTTDEPALEVFQDQQNIAIDISDPVDSVQEDAPTPSSVSSTANRADIEISVRSGEISLELPNVEREMEDVSEINVSRSTDNVPEIDN